MEDRRTLRTRQALHEALITLILEKGFEAVTIKDIVDRANVGRSTFYAHYVGKEDLLTSGMADLRESLSAHQTEAFARPGGVAERSLGFSRALFEHAQGYRDVYRALVGERSSTIVLNRMRALLTELVLEDLRAVLDDNLRIPRSALVQHVVGALLSMLTWWLERKTDLSAAEVDEIFRHLTIPGIAAAAGDRSISDQATR